MMSKQEILKAIRACAKKLKRNPTLNELRRLAGVNGSRLDKEFGSLGNALAAAGLEGVGSGFEVAESALLLDWAGVAQKAGRIPTAQQYDKAGKFSLGPFYTRYERWGRVMEAFRNYARAEKIEGRWKGVIRLIEERREKNRSALAHGNKPRRCPLMQDRTVYGDPLLMPEMAHAPVNEAGVVFAFGVMAWRLGFVVLRVQTDFPDCEAMRRMAKGQWQWTRIEFEQESRNFLRHGHKIDGCDLIVCWVHNWPECPLEVVELSKEIAKIAGNTYHGDTEARRKL